MPFELTLQPRGKRYASVWLERSHGMFGELRAKGRSLHCQTENHEPRHYGSLQTE